MGLAVRAKDVMRMTAAPDVKEHHGKIRTLGGVDEIDQAEACGEADD